MKLYGYATDTPEPEPVVPSELAEITLVASPKDLRVIASFLLAAAEGMERRGLNWEHEHLADKHKEFRTSPHFVVFNPDAG
jgi:hypothetical protein